MAFISRFVSRVVLIVVVVKLSVIFGYPYFQTAIPNGQRVPSPCDRSKTWMGVGHQIAAGGGDRNPFGLDWKSNNFNWTVVCPLDSDGDGSTNGEELGDPECKWTSGNPSPNSNNITHPGICEPLGSSICSGKNDFLQCPSSFDCPAINQSGVANISIRLPPTPVPSDETTYLCLGFYMPPDQDYHVIATVPIIDNPAVLHHMLVYACTEIPSELHSTPMKCRMPSECTSVIGLWGAGAGSRCAADEYGYRIGPGGFKYVILEIHWNNPSRVSNFMDSSGMVLYYTPNLRPNDGQTLMVGQSYLVIPPRQPSVTFRGKCSSYCTSELKKSVTVVEAIHHMHLIGKSGRIEVYRDGNQLQTLLDIPRYDYNNPQFFPVSPPLEFKPGDEIQVTCEYDSTSRSNLTTYGEATSDEMCFGFVTYYPAVKDFTYCGEWKTAELCTNKGLNCDLTKADSLWKVLMYVCQDGCTCGCKEALEHVKQTGCMDGDVGEVLLFFSPELKAVVNLFESCSADTTANAVSSILHVDMAIPMILCLIRMMIL